MIVIYELGFIPTITTKRKCGDRSTIIIKILYFNENINRKILKLDLEKVWFLICIGKLGNNVLYK